MGYKGVGGSGGGWDGAAAAAVAEGARSGEGTNVSLQPLPSVDLP